jgi:beta-galactosidase
VSDWHSLPPGASYDLASTIPGLAGPATVWAESLIPAISDFPSGLQVLAHYSTGPFGTGAALTEHKVGAGRALYLGWYPSGAQAEALLAHVAALAGVLPLAALPDGLIASRRGPYVILLNFTEEPLRATVQGRDVVVGPRDVQVARTDRS